MGVVAADTAFEGPDGLIKFFSEGEEGRKRQTAKRNEPQGMSTKKGRAC
jgi:hypothetical protein